MSLTKAPRIPTSVTLIAGLVTLSVIALGCCCGHDPSTVAAGALSGSVAATAFLDCLGLSALPSTALAPGRLGV